MAATGPSAPRGACTPQGPWGLLHREDSSASPAERPAAGPQASESCWSRSRLLRPRMQKFGSSFTSSKVYLVLINRRPTDLAKMCLDPKVQGRRAGGIVQCAWLWSRKPITLPSHSGAHSPTAHTWANPTPSASSVHDTGLGQVRSGQLFPEEALRDTAGASVSLPPSSHITAPRWRPLVSRTSRVCVTSAKQVQADHQRQTSIRGGGVLAQPGPPGSWWQSPG